jgi:hypothetical protein
MNFVRYASFKYTNYKEYEYWEREAVPRAAAQGLPSFPSPPETEMRCQASGTKLHPIPGAAASGHIPHLRTTCCLKLNCLRQHHHDRAAKHRETMELNLMGLKRQLELSTAETFWKKIPVA